MNPNSTRHTQHATTLDQQFDAAIDLALATPPQTAIPASFAARVRAALPPAAPAPKRSSAGRRTAFLCAAALLIAVFCVAPHTAPSFRSLAFDFELSLLVELACIAAWLTTPRREM